jgi:hypothetical protein
MPHYELLFSHDMDTGDEWLNQGDAFGYREEIWLVEGVEEAREPPRVYLKLWPNEMPFPSEIKGEGGPG